jgi:hypothetical protein
MLDYQFDRTVSVSFVNSLIEGNYQFPRAHILEKEAELQGLDTSSLGWLFALGEFGDVNYQKVLQAKQIIGGVKIAEDVWRNNIVMRNKIHAEFTFQYLPWRLTDVSDTQGVPVEHDFLLAVAALFGTPEQPTPLQFWMCFVETRTGDQAWSKFVTKDTLSGSDIIYAFDSLQWSGEFRYWTPSPSEIESFNALVDFDIAPRDAFLWNLVMWEDDTPALPRDVAGVIAAGITPRQYRSFVANGIEDASSIITMVKNGIDVELAGNFLNQA